MSRAESQALDAQSAAERRRQQRTAASERAAALVRETGISSAQRGALKVARACVHLYRWGWASPSTVDLVAQDSRGGYAQRLRRQGLVKISEPIHGAPGTRYVPRFAVYLTGAGRERALRELDPSQVRDESDASASRVRVPAVSRLEHEQRVQLIVLDYIARGTYVDFLSPLELAHQSQPGWKQPDAILIGGGGMDGGMFTACELELTAKSEHRSEDFIYRLIVGMEKARWAECIVICGSSAIRSRYESLVKPGAIVQRWIGGEVQGTIKVTRAESEAFKILPLLP
jgi:hypothetical protein